METLRSVRDMQAWADRARAEGRRIGLVPTMGYLHEGHLSLVRRAREAADLVVVSLFVNPTQFDSKTDLDRYPRDEAGDRAKLEAEGVDALYLPDAAELYPPGHLTRVTVGELTAPLCGAHRPGHFDGVATVVTKLFTATKPHVAVFGRKDYQQLLVVRRLSRDLDLGVEILAGEIVREPDGLAMSSRNARLDARSREAARAIPEGMARVRALAAQASSSGASATAAELERAFRETGGAAGLDVEYAELRDAATLEPRERLEGTCVFAVAAHVGGVRLIDNQLLEAEAAADTTADPAGVPAATPDALGGTAP